MNRMLEIAGLAALIIAGVDSAHRMMLEPACGVVIASRDLPAGHLITLQDVREFTVTCSLLPMGTHLRHVAQATGMTTVRPISKLDFLTAKDFGDSAADNVH